MKGTHTLTVEDDSVYCSCGWSEGPYNAAPHELKALGEWHRVYPQHPVKKAA